MFRNSVFGGVAAAMCALAAAWSAAEDKKTPDGPLPPAVGLAVKQAPAVTPKPISEQVKRGVKWLVEHQLKKGGWARVRNRPRWAAAAK